MNKKITLVFAGIAIVTSVAFTACKTTPRPKNCINDTLQTQVAAILDKHLKEYDAVAGQVIVVETATGKIVANVGEGDTCNVSRLKNAEYLLAILESGKMTLDSKVDTENGMYVRAEGDTVFDHNYDKGGYGEVNLRQALAFSSEVGMPKALEQCGIQDKPAYKIIDFYNAIANGGKMIATSQYEDSIVITNKQIGKQESIDSLKSALRYFVTNGLGKWAASDKVKVAGNSSTVKTDKDCYAEFIGYFPADAPKYTVYVSLKKKERPISGGRMAGTIFQEIVSNMSPLVKVAFKRFNIGL